MNKKDSLIAPTAEIVAAYLSRNDMAANDIPGLVRLVYSTLSALDEAKDGEAGAPGHPAVPVKQSVMPDYIVCLEDGKKMKMLKRYLKTTYGMTPDEYRQKWGLPPDYPMVAPNYAKKRSHLAKEHGLGRS